MGNLAGGLVLAVMVLFVLTYFMGQLGRAREKLKGNNRCRSCGARMKRDPRQIGKYMPVCSKCGTRRA